MTRRKRQSGIQLIERLESRTLLSGWSTVDDFQFPGTSTQAPSTMTADSAGNVYAAGSGYKGNNHTAGIVREKLGGSTTWTTVEDLDYNPAHNSFSFTNIRGLAADSAGNLYAAGAYADGGPDHWLVLERPAGQSTFSVVDDFVPAGQSSADSSGIAVDSAGNVFVVGSASVTTKTRGGTTSLGYWTVREQAAGHSGFTTVDSVAGMANSGFTANGITVVNNGAAAGIYVVGYKGSQTAGSDWVVRKSANGGSTWSTVDNFQYALGLNSQASEVTADPAGDLYVVGYGKAPSSTQSYHWLVRKSTDGGTTWSVNDDYQLSSSSPFINEGFAAGVDTSGNVFVVGQGCDSANKFHNIVRTNAGGAWHTIDDYQLAGGDNAEGRGFAVDTAGNLYAAGPAVDSAGVGHWIVRELPALTATIATPTQNGGVYSTTVTFDRAVSGFDLSDLTLTTPTGTISGADLAADGATLTTTDDLNYVLTLPTPLTADSGAYNLTLTAAGSGILDANLLPLMANASVAWAE